MSLCIFPMSYIRRKYSFALAEVLIAMTILGLTAACISPFFHHLFIYYKQLKEKLVAETSVEEYLARIYGTYLTHPPTFAEILDNPHGTFQDKNFTIHHYITVLLYDEKSLSNACTALLTVCVYAKGDDPEQKEPMTQGELELCFEKKNA